MWPSSVAISASTLPEPADVVYGTCMCLVTVAFPGADAFTAMFGALGAFFAGGGIVGGRAARYVVTSTHLQIDTGRQTVRIPRQLIGSFAQRRNKVRLVTTDARSLDFRVDSPIADLLDKTGQRTNPKTQVRVVAQIAQAMIDIPVGIGALTGAVEAEPRRWPLRVCIAYVSALFAIATLVSLT
jgi:hypothetical protein